MTPYLVEDSEMCLHFRRKKIEPSILFPPGGDETILRKCAYVMFRDSIVNVESFSEPVDIVGFFP